MTFDLLVIGGESSIGSAVTFAAEATGLNVAATTRRERNVSQKRPWFDLEDCEQGSLPKARAVLVAAGRPGHECNQHPKDTRNVNVTAIIKLIERLANRTCRILFLSTNQVFDGKKPLVMAGELPCPVTEYGRQKAEVERVILDLGEAGSVLRLTKVFESSSPILTRWLHGLRRGESVQAFDDMMCAPLPIETVASAVLRILFGGPGGIFQLSAEMDVSWFDIARCFAEANKYSRDMVRSTSALAVLACEFVPTYTTLDGSRLKNLHGIHPPVAKEVILSIANLNGADARNGVIPN